MRDERITDAELADWRVFTDSERGVNATVKRLITEVRQLKAERDAAYARGHAAGRAEALEAAENACVKFAFGIFTDWETRARMAGAERCLDAYRALAQQPPPTGGHGAAT